MKKQTNNASPCVTACKPVTTVGKDSIVFGDIVVRTTACAPANDDLLHGRTVSRCASCRDCAHGISRQTIEWRGGVGVWATATCCARGVPGPDMNPATCEDYARGRC